MSLGIAGMGWVTPLGSSVPAVWDRMLQGESATAETISSRLHAGSFPVFRVPPEVMAQTPVHPRLRRSSAISRFAATAGLTALADAQIQLNHEAAERTAIIFAVSNGGVIYTKRFYHEVVASGAQAASPLLFPETVFNAPASHLAAILGITGASYTLVGDGAVGMLAMKMAEDLLLDPALDRCLVVAAEEADWLLCDAYRQWRLLRTAPPVEAFQSPARGTVLSEGAGAILLESEGITSARPASLCLESIDAGSNFHHQTEAAACVAAVFARLGATSEDLVVASANGTFIDHAETMAVQRHCPAAKVYAPKNSLGESVGAASLWQVICAAQALRGGQIPAGATRSEGSPISIRSRRAIVSTCGMNQQVAGLSLRLAE